MLTGWAGFLAGCGRRSAGRQSAEAPEESGFETAAVSPPETPVRQDVILSDTFDLRRITFTAEADGPSIYLVGGIHGNETAGWMAAEQLIRDLSEGTTELSRGTVSVTAPVNTWGAAHDKRTTYGNVDINRSFPGDPEGNDGEQIAAALFDDIREQRPDLVLDLHEALLHTDGSDSLGNSIICGSSSGIENLILDLLSASDEDPDFPKLNIFSSPPAGSLNRTVGEMLHIPVITVETRREEELEQRIYSQRRVVDYILAWYGM